MEDEDFVEEVNLMSEFEEEVEWKGLNKRITFKLGGDFVVYKVFDVLCVLEVKAKVLGHYEVLCQFLSYFE